MFFGQYEKQKQQQQQQTCIKIKKNLMIKYIMSLS